MQEKLQNISNQSTRYPYMDNLKFILIILVVFGHFGFSLSHMKEIKLISKFIYLFHMPCFVFVSGYFAKSMNARGMFRFDKLFSILWMYFVFKIGILLLGHLFGKNLKLGLFKDAGAAWYLVALCFWYISVPILEKIHAKYAIFGSLLLGILAGFIPQINDIFSLSRVIVFFPFFVVGFYLSKESLEILSKPYFRILGGGFLIASFAGFYHFYPKLRFVYDIAYGSSPYVEALRKLSNHGIIIRASWYIIVFILSVCILALVPRGEYFFTKFGARTMQVYIMHVWIRNVLIFSGFIAYVKTRPATLSYLVVIGSIGLTFFLTHRFFTQIFTKIVPNELFKKISVRLQHIYVRRT